MGYLTSQRNTDVGTLRTAMVHGTVAASFAIEGFSLSRVRDVTREDIDRRVERFMEIRDTSQVTVRRQAFYFDNPNT